MLMIRARAYSKQFLFAGNLGLSPSISSQFTLLQPKIEKKSLKHRIFLKFKSCKVIDVSILRSSSPVLVMISSISVPICNHFHARQVNRG